MYKSIAKELSGSDIILAYALKPNGSLSVVFGYGQKIIFSKEAVLKAIKSLSAK